MKKNNNSIKKPEENGQDERQTSCIFCFGCLQTPVFEADLRNGEIARL